MNILFALTAIISLNGEPLLTVMSVEPDYVKCLEKGSKMDEDIPRITEGRGEVVWSCKPIRPKNV